MSIGRGGSPSVKQQHQGVAGLRGTLGRSAVAGQSSTQGVTGLHGTLGRSTVAG
jgi:hypothetical protein